MVDYQVGDWVQIISNTNSNIGNKYGIGDQFRVARNNEKSIHFPGEVWLCPDDTNGWGILSSSVRPAKNNIVIDILKDL